MPPDQRMLALSNVPHTVVPGESISFSLHLRHPSSTKMSNYIQVELARVEHTMAENWSASTPSSRTFSCLEERVPLSKMVFTEDSVVTLSIRIPSMAYDPLKLLYCDIPPSVGSGIEVGNPTLGICIQYFLKVRILGSIDPLDLVQKEISVISKDTGFDIDRFVDTTGLPLNRQYSISKRLREGVLCKIDRGTVSLSGGTLFGPRGQALFNLSFLFAPIPPFSVAYTIYQAHYSCAEGMGQILDKTKINQMRKIKLSTKDVSAFVWQEDTGKLSFTYALEAGHVPNFVSRTTAVSYLFEICLKFRSNSIKLAIPLIIGENPSPPPAY